MRILVTGAAGRIGSVVVQELISQGFEVRACDLQRRRVGNVSVLAADLMHPAEVFELISGCDGVIHLAAIPAGGIATEGETLRRNVTTSLNVLEAARHARVGHVVLASSVQASGIPQRTQYVVCALPFDESQTPQPAGSYGLSKRLLEEAAIHYHRWTGMSIVNLRFVGVRTEPAEPLPLPDQPPAEVHPSDRAHLFSHVHVLDVAQACCRAVVTDGLAGEACFITGPDTTRPEASEDLASAHFPDVPLRGRLTGRESLISYRLASDLFGYAPTHRYYAG